MTGGFLALWPLMATFAAIHGRLLDIIRPRRAQAAVDVAPELFQGQDT